MDSVLIVSSSKKSKEVFEELLNPNSYKEITMACSGGEARRTLIEKDFDLCIISAPLSDEFGTELALNIVNKSMSQVMLIVKSELADEVSEKVEEFGAFVISKPINRQIFWNALKVIGASYFRMKMLKNENLQLQKRIEDIKFIDRAKCILIEFLKMTEGEAHKFIEKQAMDMRISRREVAASILKKYES